MCAERTRRAPLLRAKRKHARERRSITKKGGRQQQNEVGLSCLASFELMVVICQNTQTSFNDGSS